MKLLKRIGNLTIVELEELQDALLLEIQRRKFILPGGTTAESVESAPASAPEAESDFPHTLPVPDRRVMRTPRRLRRAA